MVWVSWRFELRVNDMFAAALRTGFGTTPRRAIRNGIALPVLESITHVNQTSGSTSHVVTKPSGTVEGDWLIFGAAMRSAAGALTAPGDTVPWNLIERGANGNGHQQFDIFQKFAGASEPASYDFTSPSSQVAGLFIARISGVDPTNPINARSFRNRDGADGGTGDTSMKFVAITTDITNCLMLHIAGCSGFFTFSEPTYTGAPAGVTVTHFADGSVTGTSGMVHLLAEEPLVSVGGTGSRQWTGNNSAAGFNGRINQLIAVAPIEGPPDKLELEATADNLLFEDSSGVLLLE